MPYAKRRSSKRSSRRKSSTSRGFRRPGYAKRKRFSKVRHTWQKGTSMSPYKRFVYNDESFAISLTDLYPVGHHLFGGNSCYDPDVTGSGVQPYGYDQCCPTFYTTYDVRASKITIYPTVKSTTSSVPFNKIRCFIVPYHTDTVPYGELSDLSQLPGARCIIINNLGGTPHAKVSSYMSTSKVFGKAMANDQSSTALYNASPVNRWYWFLFFDKGSYTGDATVYFDVKITFYTVLSRRAEFNES